MDGEGEEEEQGDGHVLQDNHERLRRDGERAHLRREKEEEEEEEEEEEVVVVEEEQHEEDYERRTKRSHRSTQDKTAE